MRRSRGWTVGAAALAAGLLAAAPAAAQQWEDYDYESLAFQGIGLEAGYIVPSKFESTPSIGARFDFGYLGPNLRVVPRIAFWTSEMDPGEIAELAEQIEEVCDDRSGFDCPSFDLGEVRMSDLLLGVDLHYVVPLEGGFLGYAGAGGAIHLLNGQGDAIDDTFVEDLLDAVTPGIDVLAGVELPVGSLGLFAEGRATLASGARYLGVSVGGVWSLSGPRPTAPPTAEAAP